MDQSVNPNGEKTDKNDQKVQKEKEKDTVVVHVTADKQKPFEAEVAMQDVLKQEIEEAEQLKRMASKGVLN